MDQDADVAGDRSENMNIFGLDADGAYQTEVLALNASNTTTAVESVGTYSKIFAVTPSSTLGAQDIKVYETTGDTHLICTVPKNSALGVMSTLAIPAPSGTVAVAKDYKTDNGMFLSVTHVYNLTDDAERATNLLAGPGFDTAGIYYDVVDGFAKVPQKVFLNTGAGSEKTYEVCGTYLPYQGVLGASSHVETELVYKSDDIYITSAGTNCVLALATAAIDPDYVPLTPKLPLTASYADVTMSFDTIDIAGLTEYAESLAFRQEKAMLMGSKSGARLAVGSTLKYHETAAARGVSSVDIGTEPVLIAGMALTGSTPCGKYTFHLAKVTNVGDNAYLEDGEIVLVCIGRTSSEAPVGCDSAVDIFKLED
jgi:hypothetical protein